MTVPLASVLWDSFLLGYGLTFLQHPEDSASKTALLSDFRARGFVYLQRPRTERRVKSYFFRV